MWHTVNTKSRQPDSERPPPRAAGACQRSESGLCAVLNPCGALPGYVFWVREENKNVYVKGESPAELDPRLSCPEPALHPQQDRPARTKRGEILEERYLNPSDRHGSWEIPALRSSWAIFSKPGGQARHLQERVRGEWPLGRV